MKLRVALMLLMGWSLIACTPTVSNNAQDLLDVALSHYKKAQYASAKLLLDSIHRQFPTQIDIRKKAQSLMCHIEQQEEMRSMSYYDSIIPLVQQQVDQAARNFVWTDTVYQTEKSYIHTYFSKQTPKTGLYCEVSEQGELRLISVYTGPKLDHVCVKVTNKEVFAQTDTVPLTDVRNYRFTDLGIRWEYVTFTHQNQSNVLEFIATYVDHPLQVTLWGKRPYTYALPAKTAQAIEASVRLAEQTAFLHQLQQSYHKSTNKLLWLQQKITASDSLSVF